MIYLTYNDAPGGIYYSQVIDVISFLRHDLKTKIRLVAFISIRGFISNRKKIKSKISDAIIIPMFPKVNLWRWNFPSLFILSVLVDFDAIIARGPYATYLALKLKKIKKNKKVCFDARGAYDAEFNEYNIINSKKIKIQIKSIENTCINSSDYRIAVSNELVNYWRQQYNYSDNNHVVIPCTLNSRIFKNYPTESTIKKVRSALHLENNDIVLIYSGSSSEWQSFIMIDDFITKIMESNNKIKVIFLSKELPDKLNSSGKIIHKWVNPDEVYDMLLAADYGLLIRENTITNKVASPTKFAEYLACGLPVIISKEIGDYSAFVAKKNCGIVITENNTLSLKPLSYEDKKSMHLLAINFFTKESNKNSYIKLNEALKMN